MYFEMDTLLSALTHWGWVTHICVSKLTLIGSDNGLPLDRRQAIIWTNAGLLLTGPLGTNFGEILIEILTFSFKKMRLKMPSAKRRPFCIGRNMLIIVLQCYNCNRLRLKPNGRHFRRCFHFICYEKYFFIQTAGRFRPSCLDRSNPPLI